MKFKVKNKSNMDFSQFKPILKSFMSYATREMGFQKPPSLFFVSDQENAMLPLGKTAHYDPGTMEIVVYTDMRHPKDILRSLSHELVHHKQNCDGQFDNLGPTTDGYAQNDKHLRSMEKEAYLLGNMCLRDWEDTHKKQLQESSYYSRGDNKMNTKDWSRKELNTLLMEAWGYKKPTNEGIEHLCAMKVTEKATGRVGHPINHTLLEDGTVTHYDVEFDDVIVEGMPAEEVPNLVKSTWMRKRSLTKSLIWSITMIIQIPRKFLILQQTERAQKTLKRRKFLKPNLERLSERLSASIFPRDKNYV